MGKHHPCLPDLNPPIPNPEPRDADLNFILAGAQFAGVCVSAFMAYWFAYFAGWLG